MTAKDNCSCKHQNVSLVLLLSLLSNIYNILESVYYALLLVALNFWVQGIVWIFQRSEKFNRLSFHFLTFLLFVNGESSGDDEYDSKNNQCSRDGDVHVSGLLCWTRQQKIELVRPEVHPFNDLFLHTYGFDAEVELLQDNKLVSLLW